MTKNAKIQGQNYSVCVKHQLSLDHFASRPVEHDKIIYIQCMWFYTALYIGLQYILH